MEGYQPHILLAELEILKKEIRKLKKENQELFETQCSECYRGSP